MSDLADSQFPSPRADVEIVRESTGIHFKGSAPGFAAELDVNTDGSGRSPTATAVTMLILVAAASFASATFAVICGLVHAAALLLVLTALGAFAGVLLTGTIIAFRPGRRPPPVTGSRHVIPFESNGSSRARGHKATRNGNGSKKARPASRNRQAKRTHR
jgi:hypothetical protein